MRSKKEYGRNKKGTMERDGRRGAYHPCAADDACPPSLSFTNSSFTPHFYVVKDIMFFSFIFTTPSLPQMNSACLQNSSPLPSDMIHM